MHLNFFAYLETLGVLCIISRSANALLGFSASFTILSISYRVQKCKVTKIFASIWAADKRVVDLFWWLSSAYISLFSSRQQFRTLSCQVQLVFFSLIVIRVASLSVIETSFCQFRKFSERGRMLTHVFLDHKTCTQQLVLGKNLFTILAERLFLLLISRDKRALEATGIFLMRSHALWENCGSSVLLWAWERQSP